MFRGGHSLEGSSEINLDSLWVTINTNWMEISNKIQLFIVSNQCHLIFLLWWSCETKPSPNIYPTTVGRNWQKKCIFFSIVTTFTHFGQQPSPLCYTDTQKRHMIPTVGVVRASPAAYCRAKTGRKFSFSAGCDHIVCVHSISRNSQHIHTEKIPMVCILKTSHLTNYFDIFLKLRHIL